MSVGPQAAVFDLATGTELFAIPRAAPIGFSTYSIPSTDAARVVTVAVPYDTLKNPNGALVVWDLTARKKLD